jgi:hypothetical protein
MAPGIPLVAAMTNAIAAVDIGVSGKTTAFHATTGCECTGRKGGTAESKLDRKNNVPRQHELSIHHKRLSSAARAIGSAPKEHKANRPNVRSAGQTMVRSGPARRNC